MAQSGSLVGPDAPQNKYVTKEEFNTFATNLFTKLDELKSSIPTSVPPSPIVQFTEALSKNTAALNALQAEVASLKTSAATKDELKNALSAMEGQTSAVAQLKTDIVTEAGKFVSDVATAGYCDTSKLKDDIKAMVDRALLVCPPSSSSAEGEVRTLATKADFMALGDQYLTNLNSIAYELTTEGNKLRTDLMQKVAQMKWKTDLHLNKTEVRVNSVVEQLNAATTSSLRKLKRKAPSSYREEEVKRSKGDDGHDDQGPSHHEGETTPSEPKAAEASNPKPADPTPETSNQPQESKEQTA
jgi:hypothetical protein